MRRMEIWPDDSIEFGAGVVAGVNVIMIKFVDREAGETVEVGFSTAHFVVFADHLAMVGDAIADGSFFER